MVSGVAAADGRQFGLPRSDIDRRTGHHQLAHLGRKSCGIDQRQPASLAEPDEIDQPAEMIDEDVELGEIVVNAEKSHIGARRAPVGHEQPFNSGAAEGGNQTVPCGKIGHHGAMQRLRRAQQRRNAALGHGEVAQPDGVQLERDLAGRRAFRLLRGAVVIGIVRESQKMRRHRRRRFNRGRSGKRRPEKRRVWELTSGTLNHLL